MVTQCSENYYALTGSVGRLQEIVYTPYHFVDRFLLSGSASSNNTVIKIVGLVVGIFGLLLTCPFKAAGDLIHYMNRVKIDAREYAEEYEAWSERLDCYEDDVKENLIQLLITSKVKVKECPFEHIWGIRIAEQLSMNLFAGSVGRYSSLVGKHLLPGEGKKNLFIGYTSANSDSSWLNRVFQMHLAAKEGLISRDRSMDEDSYYFKVAAIPTENGDEVFKTRQRELNQAKWLWVNHSYNYDYSFFRKEREKLFQVIRGQ